MYLRTVLRSWPVRRAMAATVSPCWARSRIMTSSPSVTTASSHDAGRHLGGRRAPGSGAGPSRRTEEVSFSASGEYPSSSYTHEAVEHPDGREHMGGVGALPAARLEQAPGSAGVQ